MRSPLRKIATFAGMRPAQRAAAISAMAAVGVARIALWVIPFRRIVSWIGQPRAVSSTSTAAQIAWGVALAARYVPRSTCLVRALAGQYLLNRAGIDSVLRIGVTLEKGFEAHAWIECDGRILIGGVEESARYAPMLSIPSRQETKEFRAALS